MHEQKLWYELCQFFIAEFKRWRQEGDGTAKLKAKDVYEKMVSNAQQFDGKSLSLKDYMLYTPDQYSQPCTLIYHLMKHRDGGEADSDTTSYENFKKSFGRTWDPSLVVSVGKNTFHLLFQSYAKHSDLYTWVTGVIPAASADPAASAAEASAASGSRSMGLESEISSWLEVRFFIDREIQRLMSDPQDFIACWKACDIDAAFERALAQFEFGSCSVGEFFRSNQGCYPSLQEVFSQARSAVLFTSTEGSQRFALLCEQLGEKTLVAVEASVNLPALRWMKFCEVIQAQLLRLTLQLPQEDGHGQALLRVKIQNIQRACGVFTRFTDQQVPMTTLLDHRKQGDLAEWTLREVLTEPRRGDRALVTTTAWQAFREEFPNEQVMVAVDTEHLKACLARVEKEKEAAARPVPGACVML